MISRMKFDPEFELEAVLQLQHQLQYRKSSRTCGATHVVARDAGIGTSGLAAIKSISQANVRALHQKRS